MAYLLTHFWPGGTEEQYQATVAAVQEAAGGELPEKIHAGGATDDGVVIIAVHDSKEDADRFLEETLMPLMPIEGGLVGPPEERNAEVTHSVGISG
jgi:hypothetical protein